MSTNLKSKTIQITLLGILTALIILMTMTPLGYIPINPVLKLTLLTIPVSVASVLLGVKGGFIIGTVFGLSSFATCLLGMDALGVILLGINPVYTFLMCVVPRVLCGVLPALLYSKWTKKSSKNNTIPTAVTCLLTSLLNTVLFLSALWLFFGNDFINNVDLKSIGINNIVILFVSFAGINAIIEAITNLILGTAICEAVKKSLKF